MAHILQFLILLHLLRHVYMNFATIGLIKVACMKTATYVLIIVVINGNTCHSFESSVRSSIICLSNFVLFSVFATVIGL
jgi:hypothetical protein